MPVDRMREFNYKVMIQQFTAGDSVTQPNQLTNLIT